MSGRASAIPNVALYNLRDRLGLSQQDLADRLNDIASEFNETGALDGNHVSRWERGIVARPRSGHQRMLARVLEASIEELGFVRPRTGPAAAPLHTDALAVASTDGRPVLIDSHVERSQREWLDARAKLNTNRVALATAATRLYSPDLVVPGTGLLANAGWIPDGPRALSDVDLRLDPDAPGPSMSGFDDATRHLRPLATTTRRFPRYTQAIRDLKPPRLFENRLSYRLITMDPNGSTPTMTYGLTTYFDMADACEGVAHEAAQFANDQADLRLPSAKLTLRRWIGDPFDLDRRPLLPSANTLTIRRDHEGATFVLHRRDASRVALAGDALHVMPAGVFQPSSIFPAALTADFSLTRNIVREYSEEFLGNAEHNGDGSPADYRTQPLATLLDAIENGTCRIYYLGTALDALTLAGEILTVAVFDGPVYDQLFSEMSMQNEEGTVATIGTRHPQTGIPFVHATVTELLDDHRLLPGGAGCLSLAWQHRDTILQR